MIMVCITYQLVNRIFGSTSTVDLPTWETQIHHEGIQVCCGFEKESFAHKVIIGSMYD